MRYSEVAYTISCFRIDSIPHFLLLRHKKWGDWSLVGGHLDPVDRGNWAMAAAREVQEELPPLHHRKEFLLVPVFSTPITWGPEPSRSAGDRETMYQAQFFTLGFLTDPRLIFAKLAVDDLRLVSQSELERRADLPKPIQILSQRLRGGLTSIPLAWQETIPKSALPSQLFRPISDRPSAQG